MGSWGTNWGEKGYFKIQRGSAIQNTNGKTGMCGIEEMCITADSTKTGGGGTATTSAPTTATPSTSWCKVPWFPSHLTGNFTFHVWTRFGINVVEVKCVKESKCTPAVE